MLGWRIARHAVAILATIVLGGLLSATLVRLAPGFDADEQQLDPRLSVESVRTLRESRAQEHSIFRFYLQYMPTCEHSAAGARATDAATGGSRSPAELVGGDGNGSDLRLAAGFRP